MISLSGGYPEKVISSQHRYGYMGDLIHKAHCVTEGTHHLHWQISRRAFCGMEWTQ